MEEKNRTTIKQTSTAEGWMLKNGNVGQTFFTEKTDRSMTAFAKYYLRKVKTERIIAVTGDKLKPTAYSLTKVTLI
jgi:hypothetical protein